MKDFEGKKILIAEDDDDLREVIATELQYLGAEVRTAASGEEALGILFGFSADLVISDIRMPNGNGIHLIQRVKEHNIEIPVVVFMTGYSDLDLPQAFDLGAERILSKPFDLDEFIAAISKILLPKAVRWASSEPCEKSIRTLERKFSSLSEAIASGLIRLGQGGLSFPGHLIEDVKSGDVVSFRLLFESGEVSEFSGCGKITYVLNDGGKVKAYALEFEHLRSEVVQFIADYICRNRIRSFIPKLD